MTISVGFVGVGAFLANHLLRSLLITCWVAVSEPGKVGANHHVN
ncbi:MAG: hypothetical protein ACTS2F_30400 [Thainema sp.]